MFFTLWASSRTKHSHGTFDKLTDSAIAISYDVTSTSNLKLPERWNVERYWNSFKISKYSFEIQVIYRSFVSTRGCGWHHEISLIHGTLQTGNKVKSEDIHLHQVTLFSPKIEKWTHWWNWEYYHLWKAEKKLPASPSKLKFLSANVPMWIKEQPQDEVHMISLDYAGNTT